MKRNQSIPPFKIEFSDEEMAFSLYHIEQVLKSGRLTLGHYTEEFESKCAEMSGTKYAVAVNSGSSALEIILRCIGVVGLEVLVPTNTNFATAASALNSGAKVSLYDNDLYPSVKDIKEKITAQTRALIVVHIGGYLSPDLPDIRQLCDKNQIFLIEDAAHGHNAEIFEKKAGSFGHAAAFFNFFQLKL
jgi:dTDP-4-amino-4,6-dideoxygalactose transaminase